MSTEGRSYAEHTVADFLAAVAAREPAPSAGAVLGVTLAGAAGLAAMAARFAGPELAELAADADRLRHRLTELADADAAAFGEVLSARALARHEPTRQARLTAALTAATEVPAEIAGLGTEVLILAARLAADGNPNLAGDARTAARLAHAGVAAATDLVRINTSWGGLDDGLLTAASAYLRAASDTLDRL